MAITDIRLQHYRSYDDSSFELSPSINIIVGPNASGKTNLLEALMVVALGRSYRARDIELVQHKQPWGRLDVHTETGQRNVRLSRSGDLVKKTFEIDGQKITRLSAHRRLPVVLFEPNHLWLLHGSPEQRRAYLDDLLEQLVSGYQQLRRQYRRALAQRNALLKRGYTVARGQLFAWNLRLSELGEQVVRYRHQLVADLGKDLPKVYSALAHRDTKVTLTYHTIGPVTGYGSHLLKELESHNQRDCERGFTADGPHRDDLVISLHDQPAGQVASRGEIRSLVLALKIIELELVEAAHDQPPLLLLDDVFSELDGARRHALTNHLQPYQTFITTTDADVVVQHFMDRCHIITI